MRFLVLCVALLLAPFSLRAGTTVAPIERILVFEGGMLVYIYPLGGVANAPTCGTSEYYSFSMTRPMAKEYLAMLMSAHARGVPVTLWGTGTCQDQSTAETLSYLRVDS